VLLKEVLSLLDAASNASEAGFLPSLTSEQAIEPAAKNLLSVDAPLQFGRYKVLESIGEGGMGIVYRAEQRSPIRREVVVKVIKLGMDTKLVIARFEAERQALAMMDHPHIAKVYDAGTDDHGRPYFVMEYVKGTPILDYCDRNHLTVRQRLELFMQVCQAIQHAHHKGIIHRDIKPTNILVSTQDGRAFAKVIDFGIAKATNQRLTDRTLFTEHVNMIGTPAYMSPEQADGNIDIDTRTDVYSLGVVLYELLTGRTPFDSVRLKSAALNEIARIIREEDPPKPSTRVSTMNNRPVATRSRIASEAGGQTLATLAKARGSNAEAYVKSLEGEIDWMVMKAIEKDRARRYDTPNAMAEDIDRFLKGAPVLAAPPTLRYRIGKFTARYKTAIAGSVMIVVLLLAGILISGWLAVRARAAEQEAANQLKESQAQKLVAQQERDQAHAANLRAAQSEARAVEEATSAKLMAHYVSAQYMFSQGRFAPAYQEITAGIRLRPQWEEGFFLYTLVNTARQNWQPVARIQTGNSPASHACFAGRRGEDLAICDGGDLKVYSAESGKLLSQTQIAGDVRDLVPVGETGLAVSSSNVETVFSLNDLSSPRTIPLEAQPMSVTSDPNGKYLAVYCRGGNTIVLEVASLKELGRHTFKFNTAKSARNSTFPGANGHPTIRFSPSGQMVLFHSGIWTQLGEVWHWASGESDPLDTSMSISADFLDEATYVGLQRSSDGTAFMAIVTKSLGQQAGSEAHFNSRAQDNLRVWRQPAGESVNGIAHTLAAATSADSLDLFSLEDQQLLSSDRFGSLFPSESADYRFRAFDPRLGLLAVGNGERLDLFQSCQFGPGVQRGRENLHPWSRVRFWSLAASNRAMFGAFLPASQHHSALDHPVIRRTDFSDGRETTFKCDWTVPATGKAADVWGIAVTPDEKTMALLWQENSGGGSIDAEFYRKAILIYQWPADSSVKEPLPILRTINLDKYAGTNGRENRPIILSPDGKSVVFVPSDGHATIYRVSDGKPITEIDAGAPICSSPDGSLLAGASFWQDSPIRAWDTTSGQLVFTSRVSAKARRIAITSDNQKLYVGWKNDCLECFDLKTGQSISKLNTRLCPVAISPTEDRFVAFLPDSDTNGSEVFASLSTGKAIAVLNEGAHILNQARYSADGKSIALSLTRDLNMLLQNLSIEDAEKRLGLTYPLLKPAEPETLTGATQP
jgi:serine/threonine protein kinase/WD40 repeat protein